MMRLRELMSTKVVTTSPRASAAAAWRRMQEERIRHLVVADREGVVGIVAEKHLLVPGSSLAREDAVEDLMTALDDGAASPDMTLDEAAEVMTETRVGCLPVLDGDELVGVVTATDVLDELGRESVAETRRSRPRARAARAKRRLSDSPRRAPFAARRPRPAKRAAGRTAAPDVPANVRVQGAQLEPADRDYIRRKLGMKLGKFAEPIERVSVRVKDVNGPRGGVDKACRVKVVLSDMPSVVFEAIDASLGAAVDGSIAGTERALRRALTRRRTKPTSPRRYGEDTKVQGRR